MDRVIAADNAGVVMVSVEVTGLAAGVTDEGDSAHVGMGVVPVTAHESWMALPKELPISGAIVMTSVIWLPRWAVRVADDGCSEKSGGVKVAVTNSSEVIMTWQGLVPVQAVLQPENADPEAGEAVRMTTIPVAKLAEHDVPHSMPVGLLITVPLPLPASRTDRV